MKELTKAEEEIMQVLWELDSVFVKDIITQLPEPKPAYNTVSTIVRILQQKGFVGHEIHGKSHKYYPLISKEAYTKSFMKGFVKRYFSGSYQQMVSFFTKEDKLSLNELEQLLNELKAKKP
ncbi:BlaI/MecI/CopY family transcriptional regulator [Adhaeribacter radiodurans]|uniref:BlaI/MecI/CopY family transcriptional regulator n=1 Tax=Adhaeribacter radiodurans TaxID=2745197 RepID=A0A7L7L7J4_9BACT|nr:BlaI/MecI/CopY family transcriptional regulator [Adhaeribacter radiodurans]QMU28796.1 BlaI/MecI/CopY family transcriptional regulator [Adhaeribacter radiodurans]